MQLLKGKVAVITGATKGLGAAIAKQLAKQKAIVIITGRCERELSNLCKEIRDNNETCYYKILDVTNSPQIQEVVNETIMEFKRIDIWINNAGISYTANLLETTNEMWNKTLNTNLTGVFECCRETARIMKKQGSGRIVNIASVAASKGLKNYSAYTASKHGVVGITKTMAIELASCGITVNAISPGVVNTDMINDVIHQEAIMEKCDVEKIKKSYLSDIPMGRFAEPEEIAYAVVFLCSDFASYITGINLTIAGGEQ